MSSTVVPFDARSAPAASQPLDPAALERLRAQLASGAAALDRDAAFPFENLAAVHEAGLVAAVVPRAAGGLGANLAGPARIIAALAQGEPSTALILVMTYMVHRGTVRADSQWPKNLRARVWQSAVEEGALANALRVEPELGSPARGGLPETLARRRGSGWSLSGHKLYTTGIAALRWLLVWGRTDEAEPRVGFFLVPRAALERARSYRIVESWNHLGLRASGSHELVFEDVRLPAEHAVDVRRAAQWAGGPDADQSAWMIALLATLYDSIARAARDWLVGFLAGRRPTSLGAPLATLPRVQQTVGEIEALLWANRVLIDGLIQSTDRGEPPRPSDAGLVKINVTRNAIRAVDLALQLSGNHGLTRLNPLERHWRDVQCSRIHTPQDDSILLGAGLAALNLGR